MENAMKAAVLAMLLFLALFFVAAGILAWRPLLPGRRGKRGLGAALLVAGAGLAVGALAWYFGLLLV